MKKIACILFAVALLLVGCGTEAADVAETTVPEVAEMVLIDDDVVKVSFVEIFEVDGLNETCYLRLRVDNKADQKISVYLMDAYVNDMSVMMMSGVPMDIMPGKASENPFFFTGFTKDEVEKIEFKIHVYDENMGDIEETDMIGIVVE